MFALNFVQINGDFVFCIGTIADTLIVAHIDEKFNTNVSLVKQTRQQINKQHWHERKLHETTKSERIIGIQQWTAKLNEKNTTTNNIKIGADSERKRERERPKVVKKMNDKKFITTNKQQQRLTEQNMDWHRFSVMLYADFPYDIYPTCDYCSNRQCNAIYDSQHCEIVSSRSKYRAEQSRAKQTQTNCVSMRVSMRCIYSFSDTCIYAISTYVYTLVHRV